MVDINRLDTFLASDDSPEESMLISDLDGFLTGILCSPELILPSEWFPTVWNTPEPTFTDEGVWAIQEILALYNQIDSGLNADPSTLDPLFWERQDVAAIAMDWCEGFMEAFVLREKQWDVLMETEQGQDWMFPILAHLFDTHDNSLSGATKEDLPTVLDEASNLIYGTVPKIYNYWKSKRETSGNDTSDIGIDTAESASQSDNIIKFPARDARAPNIAASDLLPTYTNDILRDMSEQELFALLIGHEDRLPMEVIAECKTRGEAIVPWLQEHIDNDINWSDDADNRDWWALIHAVMILGLIPGEASADGLLKAFERITFDSNNNLADWFSGSWAALFRNKTCITTEPMRQIAENNELDWYPRSHAVECVLAGNHEAGPAQLEAAIDWLAGLCGNEDLDQEFRFMVGNDLLDFPRERYRELLEKLAELQDPSSWHGASFVREDIDRAFHKGDEPSWRRHDNPWEFYEPAQIRRRQERWAKEDAKRESRQNDYQLSEDASAADGRGSIYVETFIRQEPKIGRNDSCPCGSGKKYKKCCLNRLH